MPSVLLGLGEVRFSIATAAFDVLRRQTEYRWAKADRIGRAPALQYIGPGLQTITLTGTVYPLAGAGIGQIEAMRKEAGSGKPLTLVSGRGDVLGRWCIVRIEEAASALLNDGVPRKQEFTLSLDAYGEDEQAGSEAQVKLPAAGKPPAISEAKVAEAVSPIAQAASAAGLSQSDAAGMMTAMAGELGSMMGKPGLRNKIGETALSAIGVDLPELKKQFKADPVGGVITVINAAADVGLLREEVLEQVFGPGAAEDARQLADIAQAAADAGAGWAA